MKLILMVPVIFYLAVVAVHFYPVAEDNTGNKGIQNNLLYEETFEGSAPLSALHQQFAADYGFSVAEFPVYQGKKAGRFELRDTDDMVANGTRAEVLFPEQSNNERWYSFWIYLPAEDFMEDSYREIISQWHQGKGAGSPPNSLQIKDDKFLLKSINNDPKGTYYELGEVLKDQWQEFVFHFIHSSEKDGLIEVWYNGQNVLTLKGGNIKKGFDYPRWKVGIYKWKWNGDKTTDTKKRVLFYDNIRMGNEKCTYEEMH
ncbi:hypothetical protein GCM10028791_37650 [Echinicola sediminis]